MKAPTRKICIHHIGGRDGHFDGGFALPAVFEPDFVTVMYEADADCIEQIKAKHAGSPGTTHVLPYCIGKQNGKAVLNINYDLYTSSLLDTNPEFNNYCCFESDHDYLFGETARTVEKREVEVYNLDFLAASQEVQAPPPDFLSIDTQGSEFEILEGADRLLESHVLGVALEIGFAPLYEGQKLFGDLAEKLCSKGFHFVKFLRLGAFAPARFPIGLRADGFTVGGDALFLRRVENLGTHAGTDGKAIVQQARKLAFLALMFHQLEYALSCLAWVKSRASLPQPSSAHDGPKPAYERFLDEFERSAASMGASFPPTFADKMTFAASKARFLTQQQPARSVECVPQQNHAIQNPLLRKIKKIPAKLRSLLGHTPTAPSTPNNHVEDLLEKYGLFELAGIIKAKRLAQLPCLSKYVKQPA